MRAIFFADDEATRPRWRSADRDFLAALRRPEQAIGGPLVDAMLLWGAPLLALFAILLLSIAATLLPRWAGAPIANAVIAGVGMTTYAHLIAVVPRAYLNRDVFRAHRQRLIVAPLLVVAALAASPFLLASGLVLAVFWDVHHSAMQTFGLGRIYDMKAGNDPHALRRIDLLLNAALYIGPAAAGGSMIVHFHSFAGFDAIGWHVLARTPNAVAGLAGAIRIGAMLLWGLTVATALVAYRRAGIAGYRLSAHKVALLLSTATVSILAWGFTPPFIAFAIVNLFHAMQYFAIVWLKEGGRVSALAPRAGRLALPLLLAACAGFGFLYWLAIHGGGIRIVLAPFVAISLLHFWYDAFIWSVRRRLV